ncbi:MAG: Rv3235 family protein [Mycobacterium sp.]
MNTPTTTTANTSHRAAVTRVVDYEPPVVALPLCAPARPAPARRPTGRARHLHAVQQAVVDAPSDRLRAAAAFADAALRSILEVIDRRRPVIQLRPLLAGGLADTVGSFTRAAPARQAAAVLRRVRLQSTDVHERAFEVTATYSRGPRVHAIACRVEQVSTPRGERWQVVALHMG